MTLAAGKVELALAPMEGGASRVEERLRALVDRELDGQAARLARDVGAPVIEWGGGHPEGAVLRIDFSVEDGIRVEPRQLE